MFALAQPTTRGEKRIATRMLKLAPRRGRDWAHEIIVASGEQAVVVTGTNAAAMVIPRLTAQPMTLRKQRDDDAAEVERFSVQMASHRDRRMEQRRPGYHLRM